MSSQAMLNLFSEEIALDSIGGEAYNRAPVAPAGNVIEFPFMPAPDKPNGPRVLEPRWYQLNALEEIDKRMPIGGTRRGGKGELLVCPTGAGKTSVASRAIKKWLDAKQRVLVLVDLERLLEQMHDDLAEEDIRPLIEKAEHSALLDFGRFGNCVLASMQTLHKKRLDKWAPDSFDYIVVDEAHETRYLPMIDYFSSAQLLGLTATPNRGKKDSLKSWFHYPYIKTLTMREGIEGYNGNTGEYEKPFLSRIEVLPINAQHIDLSGVAIVGKDFDAKELDRRIWEHTNWIAEMIIQATPGRPTWVYTPKIATCEAIAKALRDMGASAAPYHSKIANTKDTFEKFERGELQYLVNVNMLIKGVNVPKVESIVRVRPSLNIPQATQEIGRGTRNSPATGKKNCLVVEFSFKTGKKLAGVIDSILDGEADEENEASPEEVKMRARVSDKAEELIQKGLERDVLDAIDKAKELISVEDEEARRKRAEQHQAKYQRVEGVKLDLSAKYDPFAGLTKAGGGSSEAREVAPATVEQMAQLEELSGGKIKPTSINQWTEAIADKRIRDLEIRKQHKYSTEKQIALMVQHLGFDQKHAHKMRKWEASEAINTRMTEMVCNVEDSGKSGKTYEQIKALPPWELAPLHRKLCGDKA